MMSSCFFSPSLKEEAIESFYSFCILMNNIRTVFRQPSDSYSGQNGADPGYPGAKRDQAALLGRKRQVETILVSALCL